MAAKKKSPSVCVDPVAAEIVMHLRDLSDEYGPAITEAFLYNTRRMAEASQKGDQLEVKRAMGDLKRRLAQITGKALPED